MTTVTINASKSYEIRIGSGLLSSLGRACSSLGKIKTVCLVSETNVYPLYGKTAEDSLIAEGFSVLHFVFPAGEASKCGETYLNLLNFLAENRVTRSDLLIALGGGVVGDLTGFVAATYLRGIRFIQVPTTLLAAVDSSVGGKTAIDLKAGKNLAGAFYQPNLVLCDVDTLNTLPEDIFLDGCAEVIKYGILYDRDFFDYLFEAGPAFDREKVICRCVELKRDVVMEDEFDTGARMKLNLGHTIGHGIEGCSNYQISHGKAVAAGIAIVTKATFANGFCNNECYSRIVSTLKKYNLPVTTDYSSSSLAAYMLSDKKRAGATVSLILPKEIGFCDIVPTSIDKLESFIQAGL